MNSKNIIGDIDYTSPVLLRKDSTLKNQLLFFSQSYQTNYAVYAEFHITESNKGKDYIHLDSINFELINYKGILELGFGGSPTFKYHEKEKSIEISFQIQAMNHKDKDYINIGKDINIDCLTMEVERTLVPISGSVKNQYHNGVFDTEFHYRDGKYVKKNERFDGRVDSDISISKGVGLRCYRATNITIF